MRRLMVGSLELLSVVFIVLFLIIGLISGYQAGGTFGGVVGLVVSFAVSVVTFGALFILLEMNESLRDIKQLLGGEVPKQPHELPNTVANVLPEETANLETAETYKGIDIKVRDGHYIVGRRSYESIDKAKASIDYQALRPD